MKERLLVMNGQRIVQAEKDGAWTNQKVDKAGALKPGIYNLYTAQAADKKQTHAGVIVHADATNVYQQIGSSKACGNRLAERAGRAGNHHHLIVEAHGVSV